MIPVRLEDYPPDARWIQTARGVVIVCKDGTVYRNFNGRTVILQDTPAQASLPDSAPPPSTI